MQLECSVHRLFRHLVLLANRTDELVERVLEVLLEYLHGVLVAQISLLLHLANLDVDLEIVRYTP